MKVQHWGIAWGLAAASCAFAASAQASVLERIGAGGKLVIAYRESSVPFSYIDTQSGKPVGYAMDLCLRLAEVVRKKTGKKDMEVELVAVTPANRIAMIEQGKADAFVMDDVLLYGLAAGRPDPKALKVVGRFMTTEPLAIMLPKNDPEFKKLIDEEMRRLITSRDIYPIYDKWFNNPIPPNNTVLNLPVSYLLRDFWKYPTDQVPF